MNVLLKCRCGFEAEHHEASGLHYHVIGCLNPDCGEMVSAPPYETNDFVIAKWNDRQQEVKSS